MTKHMKFAGTSDAIFFFGLESAGKSAEIDSFG